MSDFFKESGKPFAVAANKFDKLKKSEQQKNLAVIRETLGLEENIPLIAFSAETGEGRDALLAFVQHGIE
jgi:GTP-binding protein